MNMKQKIGAGALLAIVTISGVYGVGSVQAANSSTNSVQKQFIGIEMAEQKALAIAKGQVESIELKKKNDQVYYKVEIDQEQKEIDVLIEAYTGKSLGVRNEYDYDIKEYDYKYPNTTTGITPNIGVSKAEAVAVNYLKGTVTKVELERDYGIWIYEVEMDIVGGTAEVNVDATTAKIVSFDKDFDDDDDDRNDNKYPNTTTGNTPNVGIDKAVAAAGNEIKGTVIEVDLEHDDDRWVYEVEMKINGGTAEVKVDAKTGKIVSVDKDFDDDDDQDDTDNDDDHDD